MPSPLHKTPKNQGTEVSVEALNAAVDAATIPEELPRSQDFYMTLVAQAANLDLDDVLTRYAQGDRGIVAARLRVKSLVFARNLNNKAATAKETQPTE
jgi:hypothetical protein